MFEQGAHTGESVLDFSSRVIDTGIADAPVNRITNQLSELADDLALVESFSHSVVFRTDDGLAVFDTSSVFTGAAVAEAIRSWSPDRLNTVVYTHGHADHVGGANALLADNAGRGFPAPAVVGHEALPERIARYNTTNGWNLRVNARQFGGEVPSADELAGRHFIPPGTPLPTQLVDDRLVSDIGGLRVEFTHDRGETDDHVWAWVPKHKALVVGDFLVWVFPNAGNPQKVQRYPGEWAKALRHMQAKGAEMLLPAHGLPVVGQHRVDLVLGEVAGVLEFLVREVIQRMNDGWVLADIVADVTVPADLLERPWLKPVYDEPQFVVRNIWRQFGGWWDGDPSHLKPSAPGVLARSIAEMAGGVEALSDRALATAESGELALACELVEFAVAADPTNVAAMAARRDVYASRRDSEASLMSRGIYSSASVSSAAAVAAEEGSREPAKPARQSGTNDPDRPGRPRI